MTERDAIIGAIGRSDRIVDDFAALTGCGGRLVGTESEKAASRLLEARLASVPDAIVSAHEFGYRRWTNFGYDLARLSPEPPEDLRCHPLVGSDGTDGIEGEAVDLGRGAEEDFERAAGSVRGNFALVRHEYPFSRNTIHRRVKYRLALDYGATGFIVANPMPEAGLVTGGAGQDSELNIPAIGVDRATAQAIAGSRIRLAVDNRRDDDTGRNLIAEVPGRGREWVVLCAHYDGHDLAESALDNATGVVAALEILRCLAPLSGELPRGLRVILFTAEETGLLGSRLYADGLDDEERRGDRRRRQSRYARREPRLHLPDQRVRGARRVRILGCRGTRSSPRHLATADAEFGPLQLRTARHPRAPPHRGVRRCRRRRPLSADRGRHRRPGDRRGTPSRRRRRGRAGLGRP